MSEEKILFISHITEDSEYAIVLKDVIKIAFDNQIKIFVSSDKESIKPGTLWFNSIIDGLNKSKCMLTLCSTRSIYRNWINFEAGYCFALKRDSLIPLCIRGLKPSDIKQPLNFIQAKEIRNIDDLNPILSDISQKFTLKLNNIDNSTIDKFNQIFGAKNDDISTNDWYNTGKMILPVIYDLQELIFRGFISISNVDNDILKFKHENFINFSFKYEDAIYLIEPCCLMSNLFDNKINIINQKFIYFVDLCKTYASIIDDKELKFILLSFIIYDQYMKDLMGLFETFNIANKKLHFSKNDIVSYIKKYNYSEQSYTGNALLFFIKSWQILQFISIQLNIFALNLHEHMQLYSSQEM